MMHLLVVEAEAGQMSRHVFQIVWCKLQTCNVSNKVELLVVDQLFF